MSPEVLERPPEEKLHWLENLIDTYEQIQPESQNGKVAARTHFLAAELLVEEGIGLRLYCERLWNLHWSAAIAARVAANPKPPEEEHFSLMALGETVIRRVAELARSYAISSGREVSRLAQFEELSRRFPIWVRECKGRLDLLARPRKPFNRQQVEESMAAYARGEGEPIEDIIARLKNGGPLVKE